MGPVSKKYPYTWVRFSKISKIGEHPKILKNEKNS